MTGSHPEYFTSEMLDAFEGHLAAGGRLMYMGGNGLYWRVTCDAAHPGLIELRRAEDGTRAWAEVPGEYYHASGEYGGLWRRLGRPPNRLVGIGFHRPGLRQTRPIIAAPQPRATSAPPSCSTASTATSSAISAPGATAPPGLRSTATIPSSARRRTRWSSPSRRTTPTPSSSLTRRCCRISAAVDGTLNARVSCRHRLLRDPARRRRLRHRLDLLHRQPGAR